MSRSPSGRCEPSALIPLVVFLIPLVVIVGRIWGGITLLVPFLHSPSYEPVTIRSVRTFGSDTTCCIYDTTCCDCWENSRGHNVGDLTRRRNGSNIHKRMTPPLTQNLKAVDLWVFFLIYCLTFSFLFNVGLRLTLEFLTISPSSESPHHRNRLPSGRCEPSALSPSSTLSIVWVDHRQVGTNLQL